MSDAWQRGEPSDVRPKQEFMPVVLSARLDEAPDQTPAGINDLAKAGSSSAASQRCRRTLPYPHFETARSNRPNSSTMNF